MGRSLKSRGPPVRHGACRAVNEFRSRDWATRVLFAAATSCRSSMATRCGSRKSVLPESPWWQTGRSGKDRNEHVHNLRLWQRGHELEHRHADGTVHTHWHLHESGDRNAPLGMAHAHKHADGTWHTHVHDG